MKSLICGYGQIGQALYKILKDHYPIGVIDDKKPGADFEVLDSAYNLANKGECDIIHICFGYSDEFISEVKRYQELYKPKFTVIHSTVKPGTCRQLGAISSPCLGIHPNLESGLRTFTKFLGGPQASEVANYFRRAGMKVYLFSEPETPELMKILDTTFYGLCVEYTKDVKMQCEKLGVPFEAWTLWTNNYNQGYKELGREEFTRPNLVPITEKTKGHCVIPNLSLIDTDFTRFLKEQNEKWLK